MAQQNTGVFYPTRLASREILIEQISKSGQGHHSVWTGPYEDALESELYYDVLWSVGRFVQGVYDV